MKHSTNSIIGTIDKEFLQSIVDKSSSVKDILKNLNLRPYSWNYLSIQNKMKSFNINVTKFNINKDIFRKNLLSTLSSKMKISDKIIFSSESPYSRQS